MDNYKLIKFINEGAFGKIYLVESKPTKKDSALKAIKISNIDHYCKLSILNEIKLLLIHNSKYILKCSDLFIHKKKMCIITDYIDGGDLINYKKKHPIIHKEELEKIFLMIISGISSLHTNNIIHRDLKPANILITRNGDIKICDFGISKQLTHKNGTNTIIGTPYCMSPEVINNQIYDFKIDIWGIGCIIYYLINNRYPFEGKNLSELKNNILNRNPIFYKNNTLNNLILKLLEKNKTNRVDIKDLLNINSALFQKYNISINNSKFRKYNIKSVPYSENDWKMIVSKIVNENNLSRKEEEYKKTEKIIQLPNIVEKKERKKWDMKQEKESLPKINYNHVESKVKSIWNTKQQISSPNLSPPLPPIKKHRRTPYPPTPAPQRHAPTPPPPPPPPPQRRAPYPPTPPPQRRAPYPPTPPPQRRAPTPPPQRREPTLPPSRRIPNPPPPQTKLRENKKINNDAQNKMNEFKQRRYDRIYNSNKNLGVYNDGIGQRFYRNNNINWIAGLRRY